MLDTFTSVIPSNLSVLRSTFVGSGADGGYAKAGFEKHLAEAFQIPLSLASECNLWDYGHMIERADEHTRDEQHKFWINAIDESIKMFMVKYKEYNARLVVIKACESLGITHMEFALYSTTRFAQYRHRTYCVFLTMYPALYK